MKRLSWLIGILLFFQSCADSMQEDCGVDNPTEDLEWLKLETENASKSSFIYLVQGRFKGRIVFFFDVCNRFWPSLTIIRDCRGELVEDASVNDVIEQQVIWKPENSACNLD